MTDRPDYENLRATAIKDHNDKFASTIQPKIILDMIDEIYAARNKQDEAADSPPVRLSVWEGVLEHLHFRLESQMENCLPIADIITTAVWHDYVRCHIESPFFELKDGVVNI